MRGKIKIERKRVRIPQRAIVIRGIFSKKLLKRIEKYLTEKGFRTLCNKKSVVILSEENCLEKIKASLIELGIRSEDIIV